MGHRFFAIKLRNKPEAVLRFGQTVTYESGKFLTVHTSMTERRCDYCNRRILRGNAYVRAHTPRDPEIGDSSWHEARCFDCIDRGILPSEDILFIGVIEKAH